MVVVEIVAGAAAALTALSLLSLKLSLGGSSQYVPVNERDKSPNGQASCSRILSFLLARFTLWEVLAVRQSKYKLNLLASWAILAVLNILTDKARWWGWTLGSILSFMGFLIAEMHIYRTEKRATQQQQKQGAVDWRRPLLYGTYGLFTIIGYCFVAYAVKFTDLSVRQLQERGINLGLNIAVDQFVARPLLIMLITLITYKWPALADLRQQYLLLQSRNVDRIEVERPCAPSSPSKLNKNRSPSRVPKSKLSLQPEHLIVEKKVSSQHSPPRVDQDSMVQILDIMNRNQRSEYNTPVRKIKSRGYSNQGDSSLDVIQIGALEQRYNTDNADDTPNSMFKRKQSVMLNELEKVGDDLMVPQNSENDQYEQEWEKYEESRWKFPSLPQSKVEAHRPSEGLIGVESVRKKSQGHSINLQINKQEEPSPHHSGMATVRLEEEIPSTNQHNGQSQQTTQSHNENTVVEQQPARVEPASLAIESRYVLNVPTTPGSKKNSHGKNWLDIENDGSHHANNEDGLPQQSLQVTIPTVQSIIQYKKNSIADNYRLIEQIREETEQDAEASIEQPIEEIDNAEDAAGDEYQQDRSKTLDPAPLRMDMISCIRRQSLALDPHSQLSMEELEQVDLNSPIKKKSNNISPTKQKQQTIERPSHPPQKKKKRNKRDLKELMKLNGNSPYLEYLPNMLNKEIQLHKKSQQQIGPPKGKPTDGRPSKTTRTGEQQQKVVQLDSQNRRPDLEDLEDF